MKTETHDTQIILRAVCAFRISPFCFSVRRARHDAPAAQDRQPDGTHAQGNPAPNLDSSTIRQCGD
jgi:hypothetical protein